MKEKVHPVVRDRLKVLRLLLDKLVSNMAKIEMSETLELPAKINVMNLSKAPSEIKQLAVYSAVKEVLAARRNVIIVIDELPDFAPQRYRTPSKNMIGQAIRKGGAKGIWLWLSGQTMTGVDKQVLKQAMVWILGHQREINEAKRTLDQIPFKTGLSIRDIMTLPVGYFVVCTDEGAYITYGQPEGIAAELARKVSLGEVPVNEVSEMLRKQFEEVDDLVYKEKWEEEKRRREEIEKEFARQVERLSDLKVAEKVKALKDEIGTLAIDLELAVEGKKDLQKEVERLGFEVKDLRRFKQIGEDADNLRQAFTKFLRLNEIARPGFEPGPPAVTVKTEQPTLTVETIREPLTLSQKDLLGRIALVYAEGLLPSDKTFSLRQLNAIMEQRFGRKEAYPNYGKPLTRFVAWGYFEKIRAGSRWDYRVKMKPETAQEKGLLTVKG